MLVSRTAIRLIAVVVPAWTPDADIIHQTALQHEVFSCTKKWHVLANDCYPRKCKLFRRYFDRIRKLSSAKHHWKIVSWRGYTWLNETFSENFSQLKPSLLGTHDFPMTFTKKIMFLSAFTLNGIWSWWQFSFRFWTKWNSIWFKIKRKTVPTIISHSMWKEMEI